MASLIYSLKKSWKLARLQRKIVVQNIDDLISNFRNEKIEKKREQALEDYLDLCENDPSVKQVLSESKLTRNNLRDIYQALLSNGAGQWVKGHYVALSTIAYAQPLKLYLELTRDKGPNMEVCVTMLDYWEKN